MSRAQRLPQDGTHFRLLSWKRDFSAWEKLETVDVRYEVFRVPTVVVTRAP